FYYYLVFVRTLQLMSVLRKPMKQIAVFLFFLIPVYGKTQSHVKNPAGKWRGEFIIRDNIRVPFNFKIDNNKNVFLLNGDERFETGKFTIRKDSLFISLDQFDNELAFKIIKNDLLQGVLRKQDHSEILLPVKANKNYTYRF